MTTTPHFHSAYRVRSVVFLAWTAAVLAFAARPVAASPVNFPECPAVGDDTIGCALLITITAVAGTPGAFYPTALTGILNDTSGPVNDVWFAVAPDTGTFDFDHKGACLGTGSPLTSPYSPGPTAAQCLDGQYWTTDAMDYASAGVTFLSFNLADAGIIVGEPSDVLGPGASTWFSLPGDITASEITVALPPMAAPEPNMLMPFGIALSTLWFVRRWRKSGVYRD